MLYDLRGGLVAMYKTNKKTWIFGRDKGRSELHVARPAVEFLDLIILGWVVTTRDIDTGRNS
ncbi:hypothetical protein DL93DRAFT_2079002 [Clavulina sp. PMI_390]|nr:hypothetical protein DL93DRAFT_2079002 [Clavulina sp. PMI_390]